MSQRACRTIADLGHHGGCLVAICENKRCGRTAIFSISKLTAHFNARGWSLEYEEVKARLRCDATTGGCGGRRIRLGYHQSASVMTGAAISIIVHAPPGIDPVDWACADERGRKRLIRSARG